MLDMVIRNGVVVDGMGSKRYQADVGANGGQIVAIGNLGEEAFRTIDAKGRVVAPGFLDIHTHLDVQPFWDSTLSPSPLHGVTTVIGGNCGFTVAPIDGSSAEYIMETLSRVEGMPLAPLREGVPWDWTTTAEHLDR